MYAEAYFPPAKFKMTCHFNGFQSRRKYTYFCSQFLHSVWEEWNKTESLASSRRYMLFKLQEAGRMFIFEDGKLVSHQNILIYQNQIPVSLNTLNNSCRCLLSAFLQTQYTAWMELCRLFETFFSVYRGYYAWTGNEIELLELGDALWSAGYIRSLTQEKTKRLYFRRLFGFFNLSVPDDPCHRLGELGQRSRPDVFLSWLRDKYLSYWEDRED